MKIVHVFADRAPKILTKASTSEGRVKRYNTAACFKFMKSSTHNLLAAIV